MYSIIHIVMNKLSINEYENIYNSLNDARRISPSFIPKGMMLMRCDNDLIKTTKELKEYKKQEKKGHKFYYRMEFVPFNMFDILRCGVEYKIMMNGEIILTIK